MTRSSSPFCVPSAGSGSLVANWVLPRAALPRPAPCPDGCCSGCFSPFFLVCKHLCCMPCFWPCCFCTPCQLPLTCCVERLSSGGSLTGPVQHTAQHTACICTIGNPSRVCLLAPALHCRTCPLNAQSPPIHAPCPTWRECPRYPLATCTRPALPLPRPRFPTALRRAPEAWKTASSC